MIYRRSAYLVLDANFRRILLIQIGICASAHIQLELRTKNPSWPVHIYRMDWPHDPDAVNKGLPWHVSSKGEKKEGYNAGHGELVVCGNNLSECWLPPVFDRFSETGGFAEPCKNEKAFKELEKAFLSKHIVSFEDHSTGTCRADLRCGTLWLPTEFYGIRITTHGSKRYYSVVDSSCRPVCLECENRSMVDAVRHAWLLQEWLMVMRWEESEKLKVAA